MNGVTTTSRTAGASSGNSRGESALHGNGRSQGAGGGVAGRESGSFTSSDGGRIGGQGTTTTVTQKVAGDTTTVVATTSRGQENGRSDGTAGGTTRTGPRGAAFDVSGNNTAEGGGNSGVTRFTVVQTPTSASHETVRTTSEDSGKLTTAGNVKRQDGAASRDGAYDTGQGGETKVELKSGFHSQAGDGTLHFGTFRGTLIQDSNLDGDGGYTMAHGGATTQSGNVNLTGTAKLQGSGVEGSFQWTPIMDDETQIGASWSGTLVKTSETGDGANSRGGRHAGRAGCARRRNRAKEHCQRAGS